MSIIDRIDIADNNEKYYQFCSEEPYQNFFSPISLDKLTIQLYEIQEDKIYTEQRDNYFEFEITTLNQELL